VILHPQLVKERRGDRVGELRLVEVAVDERHEAVAAGLPGEALPVGILGGDLTYLGRCAGIAVRPGAGQQQPVVGAECGEGGRSVTGCHGLFFHRGAWFFLRGGRRWTATPPPSPHRRAR